ncbi:MAG: DNA alkylation response protein, partial [Bradyrhizobium sp.]
PGAISCIASSIAPRLHCRRGQRPRAQSRRRDRRGDAADRARPAERHCCRRAVSLNWESARIHALRGDARRLLLARLVVDHRLMPSDPFRLTENKADDAIATLLLGENVANMGEVGELLTAA